MERRIFDNGVVLDGCWDGPVRFAFTERTGGASLPPYASLNLGSHVGDDPVIEDAPFHVITPQVCMTSR